MGTLERIWIKRGRGAPMDARAAARVVAGQGIEGNANQGGWRQVTIIEREVWERHTTALGVTIDPAARRANLMVSGLPLSGARGRTLRIGACRVLIRGETKPCHILDDAATGLQDALRPDWGGGAFGEVLDDGEIRVGDAVTFLD